MGRWIVFATAVLLTGCFNGFVITPTHVGGPLCEGDRDGFCIECPRHGARFDLRTGEVLSLPATEGVDVYPVVVRDGEIFVEA